MTGIALLLSALVQPLPGEALVSAAPEMTLILVVGAPGTPEYGESFSQWADRWVKAGERGGAKVVRIENSVAKTPPRDLLRRAIDNVPKSHRLWLVFVGHGTFDNRTARINLRGPDVSAKELDEWLDEKADMPVAVVNCASASAPFINRVSGQGRVIVTATKSGQEHNFARFGDYLSQVIGDPAIDLDKDGQTSLLEAWLVAARRTQDFYSENGRLATEHALIDDNGDERGTRYDAFRGIRPVSGPAAGSLDGYAAHQWHLVRGELERRMPAKLLAERNQLELAVIRLRDRRSDFAEDVYYAELEQLLIPLATLYEEADRAGGGDKDASDR